MDAPDFAFGAGIETVELSESGSPMPVFKIGTKNPVLQEDGTPLVLTLMGPDSALYTKRIREQIRMQRQRASDPELAKKDWQDEDEEAQLDLLCELTVAWTVKVRVATDTKGKVDFTDCALTPANKKAFYKAFPAARDQADRWINSRVNFTKAS